jgi:5-methyltetrahydrofolate--homocysteine methyltransferase
MLIIGEKINGTRKLVNKAVMERDAAHIRHLAVSQVEVGADALDINAGTLPDREPDDIVWLINTVQEVVDTPLCLDSPNSEALLAGISATRQLPIINSISMEEQRISGVLPIVAKYGCRVLALALDGSAISQSCEGRMAVVRRLFEETRKAGVKDEDMFVDALVMSVGTEGDACLTTLATMRAILAEYPNAHLTAGLSNVSFGLPARTLLNRAFLTLAIEAGLDSAIVDPNDRGLMETLYATNALLGLDSNCRLYNRAFRAGKIGPKLEDRAEKKKLSAAAAAPSSN